MPGFDDKTCKILKTPLPRHTRRGPGGNYAYHKGSDVIRCLNEAFGHCWSSERIEERMIEDEVLVLVALTVYSQGDVVTHHGYGSAEIKRHSGTKKVINIGNVYKSAFTNALKKAAEQFGIGLGEEDDDEDAVSPPSRTPTAPSGGRSSYGSPPPSGRSFSPSPSRPNPPAKSGLNGTPTRSFSPSPSTAPQGVPVSRPPTNPAPMTTPDVTNMSISDTQKTAIRNLSEHKKTSIPDLIKGALMETSKTSMEELSRIEAIKVIQHAADLE